MTRLLALCIVLLLAAAGLATAAGKPVPLRFAWPTGIATEPGRTLLVVENGRGRVVRVQVSTGKETVVASGLAKPYAVERTLSGAIYLSNGRDLQRLGAGGPTTVASATGDIGPIASGRGGSLWFTTGTALYRLDPGGQPRRVLAGLAGPHGLAVTAAGSVLVSDTGHHRVLLVKVDGSASSLIRTAEPRGIAAAADGTIFLVEATRKRVGHYTAAGKRLGSAGPALGDPYDVATGPGRAVYVIDTAASGTIEKITAGGSATTLARR